MTLIEKSSTESTMVIDQDLLALDALARLNEPYPHYWEKGGFSLIKMRKGLIQKELARIDIDDCRTWATLRSRIFVDIAITTPKLLRDWGFKESEIVEMQSNPFDPTGEYAYLYNIPQGPTGPTGPQGYPGPKGVQGCQQSTI